MLDSFPTSPVLTFPLVFIKRDNALFANGELARPGSFLLNQTRTDHRKGALSDETHRIASTNRAPFRKVLVVDDDPGFCRAFVNILLELSGIEVDADYVENGELALARVEASSYDVIFLDLNLPNLSGLQTRDEIEKRLPESRVILMTSAPDGEEALKARQYGFNVYDKLHIPIEIRAILFADSGD